MLRYRHAALALGGRAVSPRDLPSMEVWPITWVWRTLLTLRHGARRQRNITALPSINGGPAPATNRGRARLRGAKEIDLCVAQILEQHRVGRYLKVKRIVREDYSFKQARRGRPGPDTAYRKITRKRFDIEWSIDQAAIAYD